MIIVSSRNSFAYTTICQWQSLGVQLTRSYIFVTDSYYPLANDTAKEEHYPLCPFHTAEEWGTASSCCSVKVSVPSSVSLPCLEVLMNAVTSLCLLCSDAKALSPGHWEPCPGYVSPWVPPAPCSPPLGAAVLIAPWLSKTGLWFLLFFPGFYRLLCDLYIILRKRQKTEHKHIKNAQYLRERQTTSYWVGACMW